MDDLKLLGEISNTLQEAISISEGIERFCRLCSVFYNVAKIYVEARLQETNSGRKDTDGGGGAGSNDPPPYPSSEFDSYLNALGFGLPPHVFNNNANYQGGEGGTEAGGGIPPTAETSSNDFENALQDWFLGNTHVMGLLESDL